MRPNFAKVNELPLIEIFFYKILMDEKDCAVVK